MYSAGTNPDPNIVPGSHAPRSLAPQTLPDIPRLQDLQLESP